METKILVRIFGLTAIATLFLACSAPNYDAFSKVGSSVLSKTGAVSSTQADAIFAFGGKVNSAVDVVTEEQEYFLGRGVSANILGKFKPLTNDSLNLYLTKVAAVLASYSEKPETFAGYHVQALDTQNINAVSAPGGFIFVSKGFLKIVPNEEALAGLMAHEVAHIVLGHGMSAINSANITEGLISLGRAVTPAEISAVSDKLASSFDESVDNIVASLLNKGYSRSQEYEADEYAQKLLIAAGYNPLGLKEMLKSLVDKSAQSSDGGWNSTHPEANDRIDELPEVSVTSSKGEQERTSRFLAEMSKLN